MTLIKFLEIMILSCNINVGSCQITHSIVDGINTTNIVVCSEVELPPVSIGIVDMYGEEESDVLNVSSVSCVEA